MTFADEAIFFSGDHENLLGRVKVANAVMGRKSGGFENFGTKRRLIAAAGVSNFENLTQKSFVVRNKKVFCGNVIDDMSW